MEHTALKQNNKHHTSASIHCLYTACRVTTHTTPTHRHRRVREAIANSFSERLQFVLGTESGMITSIVRTVQGLLRDAQRSDIEVEVVFPVSTEAITTEAQVPH